MSPWFRRKRKQEEQKAAETASAPVQEAPPEAVATVSTPAAANGGTGSDTDSGSAQKRRRGNRGGRGRKKPGAASAGEATAEQGGRSEQPEQPQRKPQAQRGQSGERSQRQERRANQQGNRRRVPQKRAPLPKAKRELLISVDVGEQRVAIIEDDRVAEVYLERPDKRSIAGNIYLGTVDNVLPGMEAAFVEIGLEKNGFLYVDEIVVPELEGKRHGKKITDLIARGQEILVQAVKDPMKTKGARLTTEISLPGRFLVFVPQGEGLGVSRRLDDAERARLKEIIKGLDAKEGGIIVRTAAEGASAEDIERDLVFLQRLWKTIQAKAKSSKAPALVYQEAELPLRIVRDLFAGDFVSAQIDHERTFKRIVGYLKKTSPHMLERVHRYKEKTPLFEGTGVDAEIRSTLSRRVDLPSGGYLVFDYAEAFTVIDVNTGRFVGSRSKSSGARLEDTITKNNLEAVKEVVRQLRLRDIGGIIVIDFIDMANPKNRATVEEALRNELERDRTKTYVVEISPLGLVEMTRQNVTDGPREILTKKCPTCEGDGIVVSEATAAMDLERRLRALATGSRSQAFRVEVSGRTASLLIGSGANRLAEIEAVSKKRFFFVPKEGAHADHLAVLEEGKLVDIQPASTGRRGLRARPEARRARPARRVRRRRQARRARRDRRRRREARRQEGEGADRARARRFGLRDTARRRRGGAGCDHVRERGREADSSAGAVEEGCRGCAGDCARGAGSRGGCRGGRGGGRNGRRRGRSRPAGGRRGRRRSGEEEDAPRLARRSQPEEEAGRGRRGREGSPTPRSPPTLSLTTSSTLRVRALRAPRGSMFPLPTWTARLPSRSHAAAPSRCPRPTKRRPSRPSQATRRAMGKWWSTASSRSRRRPGEARAVDATGRRSRSWPAGTATLRKPPRLPSPTRPPSLTKSRSPLPSRRPRASRHVPSPSPTSPRVAPTTTCRCRSGVTRSRTASRAFATILDSRAPGPRFARL